MTTTRLDVGIDAGIYCMDEPIDPLDSLIFSST